MGHYFFLAFKWRNRYIGAREDTQKKIGKKAAGCWGLLAGEIRGRFLQH